jgi:hypothetical protein
MQTLPAVHTLPPAEAREILPVVPLPALAEGPLTQRQITIPPSVGEEKTRQITIILLSAADRVLLLPLTMTTFLELLA